MRRWNRSRSSGVPPSGARCRRGSRCSLEARLAPCGRTSAVRRLTSPGGHTMKTRLAVLATAILLPTAALAAPGDKPGCADHPLFPTRLPDYKITDCKVTEYDAVQFLKMKQPPLTVEGKVTYLFYQRPPNQGAAALEIVRNYQNALVKIGATIVDVDERRFVYGKVVQNGREIWAQAEARPGGMIRLYIVEKKEMAQHIVADAAAFSNDLKSTGHVAVYGIYFDTRRRSSSPSRRQRSRRSR